MGSNYNQILENFEQLIKDKGLKIGTPNFSTSYYATDEIEDTFDATLKYVVQGPNGDVIIIQNITLGLLEEAKSLREQIENISLKEEIENYSGFFPLLTLTEKHLDVQSLASHDKVEGGYMDVMSLTVEFNPKKWNDEGIDLIITPNGKVKRKPMGTGKEPPVPSYAKGIFDKDPKSAFAMLLDFLYQKH